MGNLDIYKEHNVYEDLNGIIMSNIENEECLNKTLNILDLTLPSNPFFVRHFVEINKDGLSKSKSIYKDVSQIIEKLLASGVKLNDESINKLSKISLNAENHKKTVNKQNLPIIDGYYMKVEKDVTYDSDIYRVDIAIPDGYEYAMQYPVDSITAKQPVLSGCNMNRFSGSDKKIFNLFKTPNFVHFVSSELGITDSTVLKFLDKVRSLVNEGFVLLKHTESGAYMVAWQSPAKYAKDHNFKPA